MTNKLIAPTGRLPEGRARHLHEAQRALDRRRGADGTGAHGQATGRRPRERQAGHPDPGQSALGRLLPCLRCPRQ